MVCVYCKKKKTKNIQKNKKNGVVCVVWQKIKTPKKIMFSNLDVVCSVKKYKKSQKK